jgi:excinuclease ABC subunit B
VEFQLQNPFEPAGDQPRAIAELVRGIEAGRRNQVLLGVTGSGKTFTMANVIQQICKPHPGDVAQQDAGGPTLQRSSRFFPHNAVHYFVSYYDYYQPEAYIPQKDIYIEKGFRDQ